MTLDAGPVNGSQFQSRILAVCCIGARLAVSHPWRYNHRREHGTQKTPDKFCIARLGAEYARLVLSARPRLMRGVSREFDGRIHARHLKNIADATVCSSFRQRARYRKTQQYSLAVAGLGGLEELLTENCAW